jgi:hypothetical protein
VVWQRRYTTTFGAARRHKVVVSSQNHHHPEEAPVIDRLNTAKAAAYLQVSPRTMQRWRREGVGPEYLRMEGRIYYTVADLDEYLSSLKVAR